MNDPHPRSVADAIAAKLAERGATAMGGVLAHVHWVAIAKITVLDDDGNVRSPDYHVLDSLGDDDDARMAMAHRMVWEAERQAGRG